VDKDQGPAVGKKASVADPAGDPASFDFLEKDHIPLPPF